MWLAGRDIRANPHPELPLPLSTSREEGSASREGVLPHLQPRRRRCFIGVAILRRPTQFARSGGASLDAGDSSRIPVGWWPGVATLDHWEARPAAAEAIAWASRSVPFSAQWRRVSIARDPEMMPNGSVASPAHDAVGQKRTAR